MRDGTFLGRCAAAVAAAALALPLLSGCGYFGGDDDGEGVSVFEVKPGQCFEAQGEVKAQLSELTAVDCDQDHAQESYAVIPYVSDGGDAGDTYPGDDALAKFANGACAGEYGGGGGGGHPRPPPLSTPPPPPPPPRGGGDP